MHGVEVYRMYLAMKQHFSNPKFDFFQYNGQVKAKEETYQQRNDFWFFETIARRHTKEEIQELTLVSVLHKVVQVETPHYLTQLQDHLVIRLLIRLVAV